MTKFTKLAVFDFDGTLINTALPDDGKMRWAMVTGEKWPHKGWWSKKETLDMDVFDNHPIVPTLEAYRVERENPNTLVVLLTGRMIGLKREVNLILDHYNITFDGVFLNDGKGLKEDGTIVTGLTTLPFKAYKINELLRENPSIKLVEIWEDRVEHIEGFKAFGETIEQEVIINFVEPVVDRF